jgi:hypothetical protein
MHQYSIHTRSVYANTLPQNFGAPKWLPPTQVRGQDPHD